MSNTQTKRAEEYDAEAAGHTWFTCTAADPWREDKAEGFKPGVDFFIEHPDAKDLETLRYVNAVQAWTEVVRHCPHCGELWSETTDCVLRGVGEER